jgi:hypothetical protein
VAHTVCVEPFGTASRTGNTTLAEGASAVSLSTPGADSSTRGLGALRDVATEAAAATSSASLAAHALPREETGLESLWEDMECSVDMVMWMAFPRAPALPPEPSRLEQATYHAHASR